MKLTRGIHAVVQSGSDRLPQFYPVSRYTREMVEGPIYGEWGNSCGNTGQVVSLHDTRGEAEAEAKRRAGT